jgi:hypothetical protein
VDERPRSRHGHRLRPRPMPSRPPLRSCSRARRPLSCRFSPVSLAATLCAGVSAVRVLRAAAASSDAKLCCHRPARDRRAPHRLSRQVG